MTSKWLMGVAMLVAVLLAVRARCQSSGGEQGAVQEKLKQGARVVDVRTPAEFAGGHYPGAVNIPLRELAGRIAELGGTNQAIVVYCQSGGRSASAKRILEAAGFQDVTNAGGLNNMPP